VFFEISTVKVSDQYLIGLDLLYILNLIRRYDGVKIVKRSSWYEDNGKTRVTKEINKEGLVSLLKQYDADAIFNKNIKKAFLPKDNSKLKLFLHMFLAYSSFAMMVLTYIILGDV
tara:strand:- start:680 stop:1024 length:345 start_codon:yes stop_codon:yes gene_type:complete